MLKPTLAALIAVFVIACGDKTNDTTNPGGDSDNPSGDSDNPPPPSDNPLKVERDVTVAGFVSDRFTWKDASGDPRVAVMAHNDGQTGANGSRGGELIEIDYQVDGATRTVKADVDSGASGFGYVVEHRFDDPGNIPEDDSPLGHQFAGSFTRVFEGKNHVIFRFQQSYTRYSVSYESPPNTKFAIPVTIDWVFSNGLDSPQWSITYDYSGAPANAMFDDTRSPYGEMLFDGSASADAHSEIAGVSWADSFLFTTTSSPVTLNSAWDYSQASTIPFVKLWTTAIDATMGTVLSAPITVQDAGGYDYLDGTYDNHQMAKLWGTTSDTVVKACPDGVEATPGYVMPCSNVWAYQSINFSFDVSNPDGSTNNTRLAWGANFGFNGQSTYQQHASATPGVGYPKQSYSTFIVVGKHTDDPVGKAAARVQALSAMTVTATKGTVVSQGAPGIVRDDEMTSYVPAGYDRVYAAIALSADNNQIDANVAVTSTLRHPLLIIRNWTGDYPASVSYNGAALSDGSTYYASLRADTHELWLTLAEDLTGATNHLVIAP